MAETRSLTAAQARTRLQALFRAINQHDIEKILALYTPSATLEAPGFVRPAKGLEAIAGRYAAMFRAFPDMNFPLDELDVYVGTRRRAAARWHMTVTMTGPLDPPGLAPTGKSTSLTGVSLYEFHDGLIGRHTITYDSMELLRGLGLVPGLDTAVTRFAAGVQRTAAWAVDAVRRH